MNLDIKIQKLILLYCDGIDQMRQVSKRCYQISKSSTFRSEWILSRPEKLDYWISNYLAKSDIQNYSEWLGSQYYPVNIAPKRIFRLLDNEKVVKSLLDYALERKSEWIEGLWLLALSFRSVMGLEMVVSYENSIKILQRNSTLLKNCLYACIYPGKESDCVKSLEVFKLILSSITPAFEILHDCVYLASRNGQTGHLAELLKYYAISDDNRFCAILASTNPETAALLLTDASPQLRESHGLVTLMVKQINTFTNTASVIKEFESWVERKSPKMAEEAWSALMRAAITTQQIPVITALLDLNKISQYYISISLFATAINTANEELIEKILPFVDCKQDLSSPHVDILISLLNEYCKTPKSVLFGRMELPLTFDPDLVTKQRQLVLSHQLGAVHFIVGAMGKASSKLSIPSTAIWNSIKFHNSEVTNQLQSLGGMTAWMDAPNANGPAFKVEERMDSAETGDSDGSAFGIMQALGGKRSKYGQISVVSADEDSTLSLSIDQLLLRDNIFSKSSQSLLGVKRVALQQPSFNKKMVKEDSYIQPRTPMVDFKTESNRIWEAYFQSDKNTIISVLSNSNLENVDWMEISKPTSKRPEPENSQIGEAEQQVLNHYLSLY